MPKGSVCEVTFEILPVDGKITLLIIDTGVKVGNDILFPQMR